MNISHYPSLELCKKLTDIGFPTTFQHIGDSEGTVIGCEEIPEGMYVSPSVMEMLDVMPLGTFKITYELNWTIRHESDFVTVGDLPNALAEMILWLYENKYISFK